jgi:hypothetical protein
MSIFQLFNEKNCERNNCKYLYYDIKNPYCFSFPENCIINKKKGFPKEVRK